MVVLRIPKESKIIRKVVTFTATFNADPAYLGMYNFGYGTGNVRVPVLTTKRGSAYLIDRASVAGTIKGEDFYETIYSMPYLKLERVLGGDTRENIYTDLMPVSGYFQEQPFTAYFVSDKEGDGIVATFTGILNQTLPLIGVVDIKIFLNLTIYEINENEYNRQFRTEEVRRFF